MAKCKSCGANITWIKTLSGKNMPCDSALIPYIENPNGKEVIVLPNGNVIKADIDLLGGSGKVGYISHFATCPNGSQHRKSDNEQMKMELNARGEG